MKVKFESKDISSPLITTLNNLAKHCSELDIAVGFLSDYGLRKIKELCLQNTKIKCVRIVCGAITGKATKLSVNMPGRRFSVRIDLPYAHFGPTAKSKKKFAAMMHSKIYLFKDAEFASTVTGSHNLTQFALEAKNVEASVILQGSRTEEWMQHQQKHFDTIWNRSHKLDPALANYYDAFFKIVLGKYQFPEYFGNPDTSKYTYDIFNIFHVLPSPVSLSIGDTILLQNPDWHQISSSRQYYLLCVDVDDFVLINVNGKMQRKEVEVTHEYELIQDIQGFWLATCGTKKISAATDWISFEVVRNLKRCDIIGLFDEDIRRENNIFSKLVLDENDTFTIEQPQFDENSMLPSSLLFKKIIDFDTDDDTKQIRNVLSKIAKGDIGRNGYLSNGERVLGELEDQHKKLFTIVAPVKPTNNV